MRLLSSSALAATALAVTPAFAADPIKIGVSGFYTFYTVAANISSDYATNGSVTTYKNVFFQQEGEIHFTGQTELDNGTSVGVNVELEGWNPGAATTNSQIDEAFLFAFGDWGRVELGSRDAASYRMYYGAPSALIGYGAMQGQFAVGSRLNTSPGNYTQFNKAFFHTTMATNTAAWQDVNRINLFTPRFKGFQIGAGYAPKINSPQASLYGSIGLSTGPGAAAGTCGYGRHGRVPVLRRRQPDHRR